MSTHVHIFVAKIGALGDMHCGIWPTVLSGVDIQHIIFILSLRMKGKSYIHIDSFPVQRLICQYNLPICSWCSLTGISVNYRTKRLIWNLMNCTQGAKDCVFHLNRFFISFGYFYYIFLLSCVLGCSMCLFCIIYWSKVWLFLTLLWNYIFT